MDVKLESEKRADRIREIIEKNVKGCYATVYVDDTRFGLTANGSNHLNLEYIIELEVNSCGENFSLSHRISWRTAGNDDLIKGALKAMIKIAAQRLFWND